MLIQLLSKDNCTELYTAALRLLIVCFSLEENNNVEKIRKKNVIKG